MLHKVQFEVTEKHLKLVRAMYVNYDEHCEFGAPEIDPKRPYGCSDVYGDIGELLGITPDSGDNHFPEFSDDLKAEMLTLHKETATALQIILVTGLFEAGTYECEQYSKNWHKA